MDGWLVMIGDVGSRDLNIYQLDITTVGQVLDLGNATFKNLET